MRLHMQWCHSLLPLAFRHSRVRNWVTPLCWLYPPCLHLSVVDMQTKRSPWKQQPCSSAMILLIFHFSLLHSTWK